MVVKKGGLRLKKGWEKKQKKTEVHCSTPIPALSANFEEEATVSRLSGAAERPAILRATAEPRIPPLSVLRLQGPPLSGQMGVKRLNDELGLKFYYFYSL